MAGSLRILGLLVFCAVIVMQDGMGRAFQVFKLPMID